MPSCLLRGGLAFLFGGVFDSQQRGNRRWPCLGLDGHPYNVSHLCPDDIHRSVKQELWGILTVSENYVTGRQGGHFRSFDTFSINIPNTPNNIGSLWRPLISMTSRRATTSWWSATMTGRTSYTPWTTPYSPRPGKYYPWEAVCGPVCAGRDTHQPSCFR